MLGGYVAGSQALRDILDPAGPTVPVLDLAPAGRRGGLPRGDPRPARTSPSCIERLWANTRRFKAELTRLGFDTGASETPITPVMLGDSATAVRFCDRLFEEGVFAPPVVYPTVALDKARIRTIVTRGPHRRAPRPGARGVRPGRPRARACSPGDDGR